MAQTVGRVDGVKSTHVMGMTAETKDYVDFLKGRAPLVVGFVLVLAFLLLLVTFRSIVIPIKAIVLNLLSVGRGLRRADLGLPGRPPRGPARLRVQRRRDRVAADLPVRDPVRPVDGLSRVHPQPGQGGGTTAA